MEIGFVAAGNGLYREAEQIFIGIEAVRPESELPLVGRAFIRMNAGKPQSAIPLLKESLEINPDSDMALCFLGIASKLAGMSQASVEVFEQVIQANQTPEAIDLAQAMLENSDQN